MFKGDFDPGTPYGIDDIVIYDNGERAVYILQQEGPVGSPPTDSRYWSRVGQPISECILCIQDVIAQVYPIVESAVVSAMDRFFVDDKTLVLGSSTEGSEKKFAITVDDEGDIEAAEIEEETSADSDDDLNGGES